MTKQFEDLLAELEPLPAWVRADMQKIQKLDRAKCDGQNLLYRVARNYFAFVDKHRKQPLLVSKEKKRATAKIKTLQQKIQVMSSQKVDLANKLMQFAEMNLDSIVKAKARNEGPATAKAKRDAK